MYIKRFLPILAFLLFPMFFVPLFAGAQKVSSGLIPCGNVSEGGAVQNDQQCDFADLVTLIETVIDFLIFKIAAPLAAVMFAYAGFLYLTNRGNEGQVKQAHDIFLYVFIGLVVAMGAWVAIKFILDFFVDSAFNLLT